MKCPVCGRQMDDNTNYCSHCGSSLRSMAPNDIPLEAIFADPTDLQTTPPEAEAPVQEALTAEAPAPGLLHTLRQLLRNKFVLGGLAAALVLIAALFVVFAPKPIDNGFINKNHQILPRNLNGLGIVYDTELLKSNISNGYTLSSPLYSSLDGGTAIFYASQSSLTSSYYRKELYVADSKEVTRVADDVKDAQLSVNGKGIVYVVVYGGMQRLYLYDVQSRSSHLLKEVIDIHSISISPDGKSVAAIINDWAQTLLYIYDGSKELPALSVTDSHRLLGISNNCEHIYLENDRIYAFDNSGSATLLSSAPAANYWLNADHTQLLFYENGASYISENGQRPRLLSSGNVALVLPPNADYPDVYTAPVEDFYGHVYRSNSANGSIVAYYLDRNSEKNRKLCENVSHVRLDIYGENLYYISLGQLCRIPIEDAVSQPDVPSAQLSVILADDVTDYVVSAQTNTVYYIHQNKLYSCRTSDGGKRTYLAPNYLSFLSSILTSEGTMAVDADGVFFYVTDEGLFATDDGKPGTLIYADIYNITATACGIIYFSDGDILYATNGTEKPIVLMRP